MSLADAINQAKQQLQATPSALKTGVQAQLGGASNVLSNKITGAVSQATSSGVSALTGAASNLLRGNVSGAVGSLSTGVQSMLGAFGISSPTLTGPSQFSGAGFPSSPVSSNNGIVGGDAYAGILARSDPLMEYCWYADMPMILPTAGAAVSLPWYFVEECTPSFREISPRSIFREGRMRHYAKEYSVAPLSMTFYADTDGVSLSYLQAWNDLVITPSTAQNAYLNGGGYGRPTNYKKTININLLSVDRSTIGTISYIECWPTNIQPLALTSGSSDRVKFQVTFSVGDIFVTMNPASNFGSLLSGIIPSIGSLGSIGSGIASSIASAF